MNFFVLALAFLNYAMADEKLRGLQSGTEAEEVGSEPECYSCPDNNPCTPYTNGRFFPSCDPQYYFHCGPIDWNVDCYHYLTKCMHGYEWDQYGKFCKPVAPPPPKCVKHLPYIPPAKSHSECCLCCNEYTCGKFFDSKYDDYFLFDFWKQVLEYPKAKGCSSEFEIWNSIFPFYDTPAFFDNGQICAYDKYEGDVINGDPYIYIDFDRLLGYLGSFDTSAVPGLDAMAEEEGIDDLPATMAQMMDAIEDESSDYYRCSGILISFAYGVEYYCADTFEDCCYRNFNVGYPDSLGCGKRRNLKKEDLKEIPHNRRISEVDDGVSVHVDSEHAERFEWLKSHVVEMKERMDKGEATREWDPLFQAYFDNVKDINFTCEEKGKQDMRCTSTSMTDCGKDLIKAHLEYHEEIATSIHQKGTHAVTSKHAIPDSCK